MSHECTYAFFSLDSNRQTEKRNKEDVKGAPHENLRLKKKAKKKDKWIQSTISIIAIVCNQILKKEELANQQRKRTPK